jgi:hypothetical protein
MSSSNLQRRLLAMETQAKIVPISLKTRASPSQEFQWDTSFHILVLCKKRTETLYRT